MKKPNGWRREPARHALAAKGIGTKTTERKATAPLALSPEARKRHVPAVDDSLNERCADQILARALRESEGDKKAALALLESDAWLKAAIKDAARESGKGILQRGSLEQELMRSFRKGTVVDQDNRDQGE